jgi:BlaI family penicillinase repressor
MDKEPKTPKLGRVQLQIMQVLWVKGGATAREITDELNRSSKNPIAHSTVQTLLRKLEEKGAATHEAQGRTFVFRAMHEESAIATSATHDLLSRVFHSSVSGLVAHLLKHEKISPEEMARLRQLIEEAKP